MLPAVLPDQKSSQRRGTYDTGSEDVYIVRMPVKCDLTLNWALLTWLMSVARQLLYSIQRCRLVSASPRRRNTYVSVASSGAW